MANNLFQLYNRNDQGYPAGLHQARLSYAAERAKFLKERKNQWKTNQARHKK